MFIDVLIPVLTALGAASLAWFLALLHCRTEAVREQAKLMASLERLRCKNRLLKARTEWMQAQFQREEAMLTAGMVSREEMECLTAPPAMLVLPGASRKLIEAPAGASPPRKTRKYHA